MARCAAGAARVAVLFRQPRATPLPSSLAEWQAQGATAAPRAAWSQYASRPLRPAPPEWTRGVRAALARQLPPACVPSSYLLTAGPLPQTTAGKVDRQGLQRQAAAFHGPHTAPGSVTPPSQLPQPPEPPPTAAGRRSTAAIQGWLQDTLARHTGYPIDAEMPLASLGLSSVLLCRVAAELGAWLQRGVSPALFFSHPTAGAVAVS